MGRIERQFTFNEKRNYMSKETPAYLLGSSIMPPGHPSLDAYGEASHRIFSEYGGEVIALGDVGDLVPQKLEALEGDWPKHGSMAIFRFPSLEALKNCWFSEEYQACKHLRTDAIESNFVLVVPGMEGFGM